MSANKRRSTSFRDDAKYEHVGLKQKVIQRCSRLESAGIQWMKIKVPVHSHDDYNVIANERKHIEHLESINDTYVVERDDSNITPNLSDMSINKGEDGQHVEQYEDERALLASLIANLKLDIDENKKINKELKNVETRRGVEFHALWCYNIDKTCCGGEACHLDEQNPKCLEDWESLNFQDLVVDGGWWMVDGGWWMVSSGGVLLLRKGVLLLMLTNKGWVDGNGSNLGGGFGKPGGGLEIRGGGDGLEGPSGQLSVV
ncbi:hypothetical protein Tco_0760264 [Tanacetum coccineum]